MTIVLFCLLTTWIVSTSVCIRDREMTRVLDVSLFLPALVLFYSKLLIGNL